MPRRLAVQGLPIGNLSERRELDEVLEGVYRLLGGWEESRWHTEVRGIR